MIETGKKIAEDWCIATAGLVTGLTWDVLIAKATAIAALTLLLVRIYKALKDKKDKDE